MNKSELEKFTEALTVRVDELELQAADDYKFGLMMADKLAEVTAQRDELLAAFDRQNAIKAHESPAPMNIDRIANDFRDRVIIGYEDAETLRIDAEAFARKVVALVETLHNLEDERVTAVLTAHEVSI